MQHFKFLLRTILLVFTASGFITISGAVNAASTYVARSNLTLDVRSDTSLDGLWYRGSSVTYDATAQAKADGTRVVDHKVIRVDKPTQQGFSIGQFLDPPSGPRKPLDDLFLVPTKGPLPVFESVKATIKGAEGRGGNTTRTSTRPARFTANVGGIASDPVDLANSRVRWD